MTAFLAAAAAAPDPLARERWQHRVLLVFAASADDPSLTRQRDTLASVERELQRRDLRVVEVIGDGAPAGLDAAALRCAFARDESGFSVVLVGKDGGAKLRQATPLSAARLFETIDAMPMARDEAARRSGS